VDTAAQLAPILGPEWETYTARRVEERACELERETNFAWAVVDSMRVRLAESAGSVLQPTPANDDHA